MRNTIARIFVLTGCWLGLAGQDARISISKRGEAAVIAVPDFKGSGAAEKFMSAFNATLWSELENCVVLRMAPKTTYPLSIPQQPSDFREPANPGQTLDGRALSDWAMPPVSANDIAIGFTGVGGDQLILTGWLMSVTQPLKTPPLLGPKRYFGPLSTEGAHKIATEFAADIMAQFGGKSLMGTKVYFVSDRTGSKELWQMNYDGTEQKQITQYGALLRMPALSPDATKVAFTTWKDGTPNIYVLSLATQRRLTFYNQHASLNMTPEFLPDGSKMLFSSTVGGGSAQVYMVNPDGGGIQRITSTRTIEVEARVNPKNGRDVVFVSGRTGHPQIFRMNLDGSDAQQLTSGEGEATNPAWHPDGKLIAFSWTHGFDIGNFNIFLMDVATHAVSQLTHGAGRNENPSWGPDGYHLVFSAKRGSKTQLYMMLADGTQVRQLTTDGNNEQPVWARVSN
jgi:TolB protein